MTKQPYVDLTKAYQSGELANIEGGGEAGIYWVGEQRLHGWQSYSDGDRASIVWAPDGQVLSTSNKPFACRLLPPRPWIPESWLDLNGNPLPGYHEHEPGTWPKCNPEDRIQVLFAHEREARYYFKIVKQAGFYNWNSEKSSPIVAILIIS